MENVQINYQLLPFQHKFLTSQKPIIASIAGVGSGKSKCLLWYLWMYLNQWPGSVGLMLRKNHVDLVRSTQAQWCEEFKCTIPSDGCYKFPNGSQLFFMHSGEKGDFSAIKSINAAIIAADQAEELSLETLNHFQTRLRQQNGSTHRPLLLAANSNGHDFLYNMLIAPATEINDLGPHGQKEFLTENTACYTAESFVNQVNLPPDYVKILKSQEVTAPAFYARMIKSDMNVEIRDDLLFSQVLLEKARGVVADPVFGYNYKILAVDPGEFSDGTAAVILQQKSPLKWELVFWDYWQKEHMDTLRRVSEIRVEHSVDLTIIDSDGGGGRVSYGSLIRGGRPDQTVVDWTNTTYGFDTNNLYGNCRSEFAFETADMIEKGWLKLGTHPKLFQELNEAFRYEVGTDGRRTLISKPVLRKEGIRSPNFADAVIFAVSVIPEARQQQDKKFDSQFRRPMSRQSPDGDLFRIAGIR